jgi:hypothetical protein
MTATNVALGLSQKWVSQLFDLQDDIPFHEISSSEPSTREPALPILLKYAQAAGICVDVLIDDELDLPKKLPGNPKHRGVNLAPALTTGASLKDRLVAVFKYLIRLHSCNLVSWGNHQFGQGANTIHLSAQIIDVGDSHPFLKASPTMQVLRTCATR